MSDQVKRKSRTSNDSKKTKEQLIEEITMLREALDAIPDGFLVFAPDDRIVAFNAKHLELFPSVADVLAPGLPYQEMLRAQVDSGQIDAARGREQAWIDEWVERHQVADGVPLEQHFSIGKTIRLSEHRTSSGGIVAVRTDITDLKNAERQLQESEQRFRDFAEVSADWYWEIDAEGRLVWRSENVRLAPDRSFKDVEGLTREEIAGDAMVEEQWEPYRRALRERSAFKDFECRYPMSGGRIRTALLSGKPMFDEAGQYIGHRGVASDISARKATEQARLDSEKQYRDLAQLNPDAFIIQVDGKIVFANDSACRMFGVDSVEQLTGMESLLIAHPDHRDAILRAREQAMESDERSPYREFRHLRLDGQSFPSEMIAGPIDWQGRRGTMNIIHDITAHKQAEEALQESERRFRAIVESSPIPLLITKRDDGSILYANRQVEPVLGVKRGEMVGQSIQNFLGDPSSRGARVESIEELGFVDGSIIEMQRSDGTCVPTMHSLRGIVFDGVPAIVGGFLDITEQKRVELDLRQAKEVAEAADASKTQFLAVMSHELRTPLNAIIGFSEMMRQQVLGPLGHENYVRYAADIHRSGEHLLALITDILDLSRIEAGHLERDESVFDVADVIEECQRYVRGRAEENRVAVQTHLPNPCPRLTADKKQTKQIVLNLLTNAVKFTAVGSTIDVHVETVNGGDLRLRVVDQGPGIPEQDLERIMEPFTRLEGPLTNRVDGTGLGLSIVKRLVEGHGGQLKLISDVGRGTEAVVIFPAERVHTGA